MKMRNVLWLAIGAVVAGQGLSAGSGLAADWRQFRGNDANSISAETSLPTELSGEAIAWKVDLPDEVFRGRLWLVIDFI